MGIFILNIELYFNRRAVGLLSIRDIAGIPKVLRNMNHHILKNATDVSYKKLVKDAFMRHSASMW